MKKDILTALGAFAVMGLIGLAFLAFLYGGAWYGNEVVMPKYSAGPSL